MSTKSNLSLAAATSFAVSLAASPLASAAENPFSMTEHSSGYMVADAHEGNCGGKGDGEGKCGEGKCGEKKAKGEGEGKCGEGKCGKGKGDHGDKKGGEGKCGEGKCGG